MAAAGDTWPDLKDDPEALAHRVFQAIKGVPFKPVKARHIEKRLTKIPFKFWVMWGLDKFPDVMQHCSDVMESVAPHLPVMQKVPQHGQAEWLLDKAVKGASVGSSTRNAVIQCLLEKTPLPASCDEELPLEARVFLRDHAPGLMREPPPPVILPGIHSSVVRSTSTPSPVTSVHREGSASLLRSEQIHALVRYATTETPEEEELRKSMTEARDRGDTPVCFRF